VNGHTLNLSGDNSISNVTFIDGSSSNVLTVNSSGGAHGVSLRNVEINLGSSDTGNGIQLSSSANVGSSNKLLYANNLIINAANATGIALNDAGATGAVELHNAFLANTAGAVLVINGISFTSYDSVLNGLWSRNSGALPKFINTGFANEITDLGVAKCTSSYLISDLSGVTCS
jgi:hypothetical protein